MMTRKQRLSAIEFKTSSGLELIYWLQLEDCGFMLPIREHKFHQDRKWRLDFAWLHKKLAVEIEGGTFRKSRHTSGTGFHNDCEKYNTALLMGWKILRFDSKMVHSLEAIETTKKALRLFKVI